MEETERKVAEDLGYILEFLELNNEMDRYLSLFQTLKDTNLDGMHIFKLLKEYCNEKSVSITPERMDMLEGYGNYTYMKRKWKRELRRHKDVSHPWEEVIGRVVSFGKPLWTAICEDRPFVGDWMPNLGRFLE